MFSDILSGIAALVIAAANVLIAGVGAVLGVLVALMPEMPALPELPEAMQTATGWVAWFFPVGTLIEVLLFTVTVWLLWQAVALALRWAKALDS